jgi:hypothetical protein
MPDGYKSDLLFGQFVNEKADSFRISLILITDPPISASLFITTYNDFKILFTMAEIN